MDSNTRFTIWRGSQYRIQVVRLGGWWVVTSEPVGPGRRWAPHRRRRSYDTMDGRIAITVHFFVVFCLFPRSAVCPESV